MPPPTPIVRYARYGAVAFEFSGTIGAGCVIGWLLDKWFGTQPYLVVFSTLAAVVGGFIRLIQILRGFDRLDRDPPPGDGEP